MAKTVLSLRDLAGLVLYGAGVWAGTCILLVGVMLYEMGDLDAPIDFVPGISEQIIEGLFLTVTLAAGLSIAGCSMWKIQSILRQLWCSVRRPGAGGRP